MIAVERNDLVDTTTMNETKFGAGKAYAFATHTHMDERTFVREPANRILLSVNHRAQTPMYDDTYKYEIHDQLSISIPFPLPQAICVSFLV